MAGVQEILPASSSSGSGGTQYTDGAAASTHPVGTQQVFTNGSNVTTAVSTSNPLPVSASVAPTPDASSSTQNITAQDVGSSTTTGANSQPITTGTATANSTASFSLSSWETILVMASGTWTGTIMSEGSFDGGTTWVSKAVKQIGTAYTANSLTGNFAGAVNTSGLTHIRFRATATWTGTATILIRQSTNVHSTYIANNLTLKDGTTQSIPNTIKAASTATNATDTSLVVGLSPNSNSVNLQLSGTAVKDDTQFGDGVTTGIASTANRLYNGTSYDRQRSIGTGIAKSSVSDASNDANVVVGDTGFNGLSHGSGIKTVSFSTSATGVQTLIADTDTRGYTYAELVLTSAGTGLAWTVATSATSGGTYATLPTGAWKQPGTNSTGLGVATGTWYNAAIKGNFLRINISAMTAGTTSGFLVLKAFPQSIADGSNVNAAQFGTWNVGSSSATGTAIPANAFYMGLNGTSGQLTGVLGIGVQADAATGNSAMSAGVMAYNGATYDRGRNNTTAAVIAAGATTTQTGITFVTYNARRLMVLVNITAGAGTVTVAVNATSASGYSTNLLTSTALTGVGTTALRIFDGATPSANLVANDSVPRTVSITATVTGTITYGVDYILGV